MKFPSESAERQFWASFNDELEKGAGYITPTRSLKSLRADAASATREVPALGGHVRVGHVDLTAEQRAKLRRLAEASRKSHAGDVPKTVMDHDPFGRPPEN